MRFTFAADAHGGRSLLREPPPWPPAGRAVTLTRLRDDAPPEPLQLLEAGEIDDALSAGQRRLKANPNDPTLSDGYLGSVGEGLLYRQLDAHRAVSVFQLDHALHAQSPTACVNLAEALFRAGRRSEAVPLYGKAQRLFARDTTMGETARIEFRWKLARVRALETPSGP